MIVRTRELALETWVLGLSLLALLIYPLVAAPEVRQGPAGLEDTPFLHGAIRLGEFEGAPMLASGSNASDVELRRRQRSIVATLKLSAEPGWPGRHQPSRLARDLALPESWSVFRLEIIDLGVASGELDVASLLLQVHALESPGVSSSERVAEGRALMQQIAGLPAAADPVTSLESIPQRIKLDDRGVQAFHSLPIVFKEEVDLARVTRASLLIAPLKEQVPLFAGRALEPTR